MEKQQLIKALIQKAICLKVVFQLEELVPYSTSNVFANINIMGDKLKKLKSILHLLNIDFNGSLDFNQL